MARGTVAPPPAPPDTSQIAAGLDDAIYNDLAAKATKSILDEIIEAPYTPPAGTVLVDGCELDEDEDEETERELRECGCVVEESEVCWACQDRLDMDTCEDCCNVTHCENCGRDKEIYDDCNDDNMCSGCCSCNTCDNCGSHYGNDWLGGCYDCYCCSNCGCSCDGDGEYSEGWQIKQAPWAVRGINIVESSVTWKIPWTDQWPQIDQNLDPVQAMADFYMLEITGAGILNGVHPITSSDPLCREIAGEAKAKFNELVEKLDCIFCAYVDMVVGGEVRHHQATGSLRRDRAEAWSVWKELRDAGGEQVLLDAAELFRDIPNGGIGGEAWAIPAQLLHDRLTGKLNKRDWVDRAFTLEHNNGCLFNKISWNTINEPGWAIQSMAGAIGPAHSADPTDWGVLLAAASNDTRSLFRRWWQQTNVLRRLHGLEVTRIPTMTDDATWVGDRREPGAYIEFRTGSTWMNFHPMDRWRDGDCRWLTWLPSVPEGKALADLIWRLSKDPQFKQINADANYWNVANLNMLGMSTTRKIHTRPAWALWDACAATVAVLRFAEAEINLDSYFAEGEPMLWSAASRLIGAIREAGRTEPQWLKDIKNSAPVATPEPVTFDDEDDEDDVPYDYVEGCGCDTCAATTKKKKQQAAVKNAAQAKKIAELTKLGESLDKISAMTPVNYKAIYTNTSGTVYYPIYNTGASSLSAKAVEAAWDKYVFEYPTDKEPT